MFLYLNILLRNALYESLLCTLHPYYYFTKFYILKKVNQTCFDLILGSSLSIFNHKFKKISL